MSLSKFISVLGKDEIIATVAFASGLAYICFGVKQSNFIEYPLSTLFAGSIHGMWYAIGASFISSFMPQNTRFIIPLSLLASTGYYTFIKKDKSSINYGLKFQYKISDSKRDELHKNIDSNTVTDTVVVTDDKTVIVTDDKTVKDTVTDTVVVTDDKSEKI